MSILNTTDMWRSNNTYYSSSRYKHLILHNGSLYLCNETHKSGPTFDSTKFTAVSGSGGLAGAWDMTNTSTILTFDDFFGCGISGSGPYTITPDTTQPIVATSTSVSATLNVPVVFQNLSNPSSFDPLGIYFGFANVEATLSDIVAGFNAQPAPSLTYACFGNISSDNTISYINGITSQSGTVTDGLAHPNGQSISFKVIQNGIDYELYAKVTSDSTYRLLTSHPMISAPNGVKPVIIGLYLGGFTTPMTILDTGSSLIDPETPPNPIGKRYLVNGAGTYKNQTASVGNVVEFIDADNIFITEDIEDINDGIGNIVVSLQQDIAAVPVSEGVLTNTNITGTNVYTYVNVADITTEMVTVNYNAIPASYVNFFNVNIRRGITNNSDMLVRINFPEDNVSYNPDQYVFTINSGTIGGFDSYHYRFDIKGVSSLLFRCVNGMLEYLGYIATVSGEFSETLPFNGHEIIIDETTPSTTHNVGNYSDIRHVILSNATSNPLDGIVINTDPTALSMKHLPQVMKDGIKISIIPGSGSFTNININGKILFSSTPAASGTYHYYVYYPYHDILIQEATNP